VDDDGGSSVSWVQGSRSASESDAEDDAPPPSPPPLRRPTDRAYSTISDSGLSVVYLSVCLSVWPAAGLSSPVVNVVVLVSDGRRSHAQWRRQF